MEAGKAYRIVVAFKYDAYETTVFCMQVLAKSYRVRHYDTRQYQEMALIKKTNLVKFEEVPTK